MRTAIFGAALLFIIALGAMTVSVALTEGIEIIVILALIVLALLGFGIIGALLHKPHD